VFSFKYFRSQILFIFEGEFLMNNVKDVHDLIPIHIGLLGHIDAGKTAIARSLSKIISTSGLDKHPQSQKRGITIDLGFTFFPLNQQYMITLVDAPGHADLIRSVVSCANIIDMAFLVIDAQQGPQIQTGEHLLILDLLEIPSLILLINKVDLVSQADLADIIKKSKKILKGTRFENNFKLFPVSAKLNQGFSEVQSYLVEYLESVKIERNTSSPLKFLFDHHFAKKGYGTVLTGTVLTGSAKIGDSVVILPQNFPTKIKSIQKWKQSANFMQAGDRCGIAVSEIHPDTIFRGCFVTNKKEDFQKGQIFEIVVQEVSFYQHGCPFGLHITVNHEMMSLNARIFPFVEIHQQDEPYFVKHSPKPNEHQYRAILWLESEEYIQMTDIFLLSRLDLSPKSLRIMGSAKVVKILVEPVFLNKEKIKTGRVKNSSYSPRSVIVEGLSSSKIGAHTIINLHAEEPFGKIVSSFGQNGNVEVQIHPSNFKPENDVAVSLKLYKPFKLWYQGAFH
jgi:selenocysteine-specific elongation factor